MSLLFKELFRFIYPTRCLYCEEEVEDLLKPLCKKCISSLTLSYHSKEEEKIYCFEQASAAKELLKRYEKTHFKNLGQLIISLMVLKFVNMGWEMPDLVISGVKEEVFLYKPSPLNHLLAQGFAKNLGLPYRDLLKYTLSDKVYDKEGCLQGHVILKKRSSDIKDKNILIIQDEMKAITKNYETLFPKYRLFTFLSEASEKDFL